MKSCVLIFSLLFFFVVPSTLLSQSREDLINGAKKEGKLVIYSLLALPDHAEIVNAFKQKYPFIEVSLQRPGAGEGIFRRVVTEAAANKYLVDIIGVDQALVAQLVKRNLLMRYDSPERESFEPSFKDKEAHWTAFYVNPKVIPYNTKLVRAEEAPKSYSDLLDPKWKGKLVMEDTEAEWFATLFYYWGEKKTLDYMRQLAKQNFTMRRGHTLLTQLIAAGEYPGAVILNGPRVELTRVRGAPIDWNPPEPTVVDITTMGIAARAPHPNAAKLYIDHVLSREIQENYLEKKFLKPSGRKGVVSTFMEKVKRTQVKTIPLDVRSPDDLPKFHEMYKEIFK